MLADLLDDAGNFLDKAFSNFPFTCLFGTFFIIFAIAIIFIQAYIDWKFAGWTPYNPGY